MNRPVPILDTLLAAALAGMICVLCLLLLAAAFLVGFAIGKFAIGSLLLAMLGGLA